MTSCDPAKFPETKYFNQHEIPPYGPAGFKYKYTRIFTIDAKGSPDTGSLKTFSIGMSEPAVEEGKYPGVPYEEESWEEALVQALRSAPPFAPPTPLDMKLWFASRVVIILKGSFWQFSRKLAPLTTKHQYGAQYFDLLMHKLKDDTPTSELISLSPDQWQAQYPTGACQCISFFALEPCRDSSLGYPKMYHGFSLNIEILHLDAQGQVTQQEYLPITIDPDIENKGGGPPP